jgi:hypothetical protein
MIRPFASFVLVALAVIGFEAAAIAQNADLSGTYRCEGTSPAGNPYRSIVEISKEDQTYVVKWRSRGSPAIGIGIVRNDTLSVSYFTGKDVGIVVYRIEKGPKLTGQWTILGADGQLYPEVLTRVGLAAEQQQNDEPLAMLPPRAGSACLQGTCH